MGGGSQKVKKKTKKFLQQKLKQDAKKDKKKKVLSHKIEHRGKVKKSKETARHVVKAAEESKKKQEEEEKIKKQKASVDDLLECDFFQDSDEEGFKDVSDDDKDEDDDDEMEGFKKLVEDDDKDEDDVAYDAKGHAAELAGLKDSDPSFYKFLQENDAGLLDFDAAEGEVDDEEDEAGPQEHHDDEEEKGEQKKKKKRGEESVLTAERFDHLVRSAEEKKSFHALRVLFSAFRSSAQLAACAVAKVPEKPKEMKNVDKNPGNKGNRKERQKQVKKSEELEKRQAKALIEIPDDEVMRRVIQWVCANASRLLEHHLGERKKTKEKTHSLDITAYKNAGKCGRLGRSFWSEALFLMKQGPNMDLKELIMETCASEKMQRFLWPFGKLRNLVYKEVGNLWSLADRHRVRLLAFLFLRNAVSFPAHVARHDGMDAESIVRMVCKMFAHATERGYTWRSVSGFRFMENGLVELMRIDDKMAYRIGYAYIRQLALVLRNAMHTSTIKEKNTKEKKISLMYSWSFVRSLYCWTHLVVSIKALEPLSYPLMMVLNGAIKTQINNLHYFPYVYHCMRCLCKLGSGLEKFVPISSYILPLLSTVATKFNKVSKNSRVENNKGLMAKTQDVEVLLRFSDVQIENKQTIEHIATMTMQLCVDHMGVLARTPAFPELAPIVLFHLRKICKNLHSETLRRDIKTLISSAETSIAFVTRERDTISFESDKFLVFDANKVALGELRKQWFEKRERELAQKIESAVQETPQKAKKRVDDEIHSDDEGEKEERQEKPKELSKRALKRQRQKQKRIEEMKSKTAGENDEARNEAKRQRPNLEEDVVETIIFSDDDDDVAADKENEKATNTKDPSTEEKKMKNQTFGSNKKSKKNKIKQGETKEKEKMENSMSEPQQGKKEKKKKKKEKQGTE